MFTSDSQNMIIIPTNTIPILPFSDWNVKQAFLLRLDIGRTIRNLLINNPT